MPRDNIILRKRAIPKKVTLPNGGFFMQGMKELEEAIFQEIKVARRGRPGRQKNKEGIE